ncbi:Saposin like protein, partial [Aduncisulcus paluster]
MNLLSNKKLFWIKKIKISLYIKIDYSESFLIKKMQFFNLFIVFCLSFVIFCSAAPVESSFECDLCEFLVTELEERFLPSMTEEEFIAEFDSLCDEIPTFFAIACKAEVDQYGPTIYQDLQNGLEPDTICDEIHMCHESLVAPVEGSVECIACKQIVQTIEDKYVDGMLYDDLYDLVIEECDKLPEWIAVVCDSEVDYYLPQMWTMLVDDHIEPQEMCALLGQCKKSAAPKGNDVTCEVCEIIVDAVEDAWLPNITYQELYNTIMNDTCRKLPHVLEIACQAEVDEYLPEIYSMMQNAVAPSTICGLLTLCKSAAAPVESSFECDLCEFLVTELEERFLPSMTEEEFIAEFDSLCDEIPTFFAIACKAEVDQYGPTIYQDLQNGLEPDTICDEIHMCHESLVEVVNGDTECTLCNYIVAYAEIVNGDTECTLCNYIVAYAESKFLPEMSLEDFLEIFEGFCEGYLPSFLVPVCDTLVDTYATEIYEWLQKEEDPSHICGLIDLCKTASKFYLADNGSVGCDVCEVIVDAVEEAWFPNITYEEIYDIIMNDTCRRLPTFLEVACQAEIDEYLPQIYDMMKNAIAPETICHLLDLCADAYILVRRQPREAPVESSFECDLCEFLVTELEERFLPSMTEEEFIAEFDSLCDEIPTFFAIACKAEVDQYGPTIYQDLQNDLEPDTICDGIHMCHESLVAPVEGSVECIACKQIVQTIEDKYVDGMLYDDLYDLVIEECDKLPEWIAVVCDSEVDYYLPQMWTMLVDDHIEPQEMCALLGQCKKSAAPKGNDVTCE